jgi:hypothetical protein
MLKLFAPLLTTVLATISITACVDNNNASSQSAEPTTETNTESEAAKKANLIKATKAAIVIEGYDSDMNIKPNQVTPANNGSMKGDHER